VGAVFKTPYMLMNLLLVMVKHLGKSRTTVCHRHFRGTCSSVDMLKKYMIRERLATPGLMCAVWIDVNAALICNTRDYYCVSLPSHKTVAK